MRSWMFLAPCLLLACSGADFGVGAESPDSTSADADDETGTDAADTSVADTGSADVAPDTTPEETCVKNACGGCTALVGNPGDACPSCGGKLKCKGTDALECDSTVPKNECGGCSVLAVAKGTVCGVCNTGAYACDGTDATKCIDPVTGPMPMSACGTCGTKKVICDAMSPGGTKCEGDDANACGGCGMLSHSTTDKCGVCNTGSYSCDSTTKDRTKCTDPVTGKTPGTACGTCGTKKIICDATATATGGTRCEADDANECGGCTIFPSASKPGASCGACGGKYACNGKEATKCSDNNPVPLATKCGMYCNASSYKCSSGQTVCSALDDRKDGTDILTGTEGTPIWTLNTGETFAISFASQRLGAISGFTVSFFRYDESGSAPDPGTVRIRLIKGSPTTSPLVADVLATFNVPGDAIFATGPYDLSLTLPTPTAIYPAGTVFYVEIQENSYRYNYAIAGGTPAAVSKTDWWYPSSSPAGYDVYKTADPFLKVQVTGCF